MKSVLRIATMDPDEGTRNLLKTLLLGIDTVWLQAECSRYEFFMDVIQQTQPDMGLIYVDGNPQQAIDLIGEIVNKFIKLKRLTTLGRVIKKFYVPKHVFLENLYFINLSGIKDYGVRKVMSL